MKIVFRRDFNLITNQTLENFSCDASRRLQSQRILLFEITTNKRFRTRDKNAFTASSRLNKNCPVFALNSYLGFSLADEELEDILELSEGGL